MKTKVLIITSIFLLGLFLKPELSFAKKKSLTKTEQNDFKKAISHTIKYPTFASEEKIGGTIWIQMTVSEEGIMSIEASNYSCCEEFIENVKKQIDGKKIKKFKPNMVGVHHVKFSFTIEE